VRPQLAQRLVALAGLALVGAVIALAVTRDHSDSHGGTNALPEAAPAPGGGWYRALGAPASLPRKPRRTACGVTLRAHTVGVAHPTLPCNVKIFIEYGGKRVLTQVIDRGPSVPGRQFDLTEALAHRLGLVGVQRIAWSYAGTR
jgi:Lytic transglycolase